MVIYYLTKKTILCQAVYPQKENADRVCQTWGKERFIWVRVGYLSLGLV